MANADLKIQRKNMELSKSCILFFSVIICISSMHMTQARMAAAMGSTTVSDRFCSILKMPLFHACGVAPYVGGDFSDFGIYIVKQPGQVARDAVDQNTFYPFFNDFTNHG